MGRVYKALVRAEKWQGGDHPIGRPISDESALEKNPTPRAPFSFSPDATTPAESARHAKRTLPALHRSAQFLDRPVQRPSTPRESRLSTTEAPRIVQEPPAASEKGISFEEPADVSDLRNLVIDQRIASLINENPMVVERYRGLAAKLLNLAERRKLKTLLVTSAQTGEGKTMVSTVVAWFLSKYPERRVLLIDGNISMPSVGRTLGLSTRSGWLNLANGSCDAKRAIIRIDPNGLCVMTPGTPGEHRAPDATASNLEKVIAMLSPRFDLILVDATAILESPETRRLAEVLDGTLIVARAGYTHHSKVTAARKLVPKERRLGVVLNEADGDVEPANRKRRKKSLMGKLFGTKE